MECLWSEQWKWLIHVVGIESHSTRVQYTGWVLCFFVVLKDINPLNSELNLICHLLVLLEAHHILHVSRLRVKTKHDLRITSEHVASIF